MTQTTKKEIKNSFAIDCTSWKLEDLKKILPAKREVAYAVGVYGITAYLFIGADDDLYKVVGRCNNLLHVLRW